MKPIETKIWRELELFAQAMQRGASVHLGDGNTVVPSGDPTGSHVSASVLRQHPIVKIIESTVLRDWTAEDARKHVGFVARKGGMFVIVPGHAHSQFVWADHEYAAPIPGTDPAKWDWKPCKVEVPAEAPKPCALDKIKALRKTFVSRSCDHARRAMDGLDDIIMQMEQP